MLGLLRDLIETDARVYEVVNLLRVISELRGNGGDIPLELNLVVGRRLVIGIKAVTFYAVNGRHYLLIELVDRLF
jgi:hypothetical protein